MGLFLNVLIVQNAKEQDVRKSLQTMGERFPKWSLDLSQCSYQECGGGVKVFLNEHCCGYHNVPQAVSEDLSCPALLCYIYDGDFWGYYFYDRGERVDAFDPIPDYFGEVSEKEREELRGQSEVIARYFNVEPSRIERYLVPWDEELLDSGEFPKAYPDDKFGTGEDWQMADFLRTIGYPYGW